MDIEDREDQVDIESREDQADIEDQTDRWDQWADIECRRHTVIAHMVMVDMDGDVWDAAVCI